MIGTLWPSSDLPSRDKCDASQIDAKIGDLLYNSRTEEFVKILELLSFEPFAAEDAKRGSFIKLIISLTLCAEEALARKKNYDQLAVICSHTERIFDFYLVICENCRDKKILGAPNQAILANMTYILQFQYLLLTSLEDSPAKQELKKTLRNCVVFLLSVIETINNRTNNFATYDSLKETALEKPSSTGNYTLLSYELFKNILSIDVSGSLLSVEDIKQLKANDFSTIDSIILSDKWADAFTDNVAISDLVDRYYGENIRDIAANVLSMVTINAQRMTSMNGKQVRNKEESAKRCENEILEKAAQIHEMEDARKHEVAAFEEERVRIAKNSWRRHWKRLRVYIGQWRHPNFYNQFDKKYGNDEWEKMKPNPIYYRKISKYETRSRARPFTKIKLIEPEHVTAYNDLLNAMRAGSSKIVSINTELFSEAAVQNMFTNMDLISPGLAKVNKAFSLSQFGKNIKKTFMKVNNL